MDDDKNKHPKSHLEGPQSSGKIKELELEIKWQEKKLTRLRSERDQGGEAARLHQSLTESLGVMKQLSNSAESARAARGRAPTFDIGSGEHIITMEKNNLHFQKETATIPDSIKAFNDEAPRLDAAINQTSAYIKRLQDLCEFLVNNDQVDADKNEDLGQDEADDDNNGATGADGGVVDFSDPADEGYN